MKLVESLVMWFYIHQPVISGIQVFISTDTPIYSTLRYLYPEVLYIPVEFGLMAHNWQKWKKYIPHMLLPWNL